MVTYRKKGDGEYTGTTKCKILIFIAKNKRASTSQIKEFLRDQLYIKSKSGINLHLSELETRYNFLNKSSLNRGYDTYYNLKDDFDSFKSIFNFLKANSYTEQIIETQYFLDIVENPSFKSRLLANLLRNCIFGFIDYMANEQNYEELVKFSQIPKEKIDEFTKMLQSDDFKAIYEEIKNQPVEKFMQSLQNDKIFDVKLTQAMMEFVFPNDELAKVIELLKVSPSVLEFTLNLSNVDPVGFFGSLMRYYGNLHREMFSLANSKEKALELNIVYKKFIEMVMSLMLSIFLDAPKGTEQTSPKSIHVEAVINALENVKKDYKVINETPLFTMTKSLFISDFIKRKAVGSSQLATDLLNEIFIPHVVITS